MDENDNRMSSENRSVNDEISNDEVLLPRSDSSSHMPEQSNYENVSNGHRIECFLCHQTVGFFLVFFFVLTFV